MSKALRILLVEDDFDCRAMIEDFLTLRGFDVLLASNGSTALECLQTTNVDVIISDVEMPERSGIWLIETLRSLGVNTPVWLMTGGAMTREDAFAVGASLFLEKPFYIHNLISALLDFEKSTLRRGNRQEE